MRIEVDDLSPPESVHAALHESFGFEYCGPFGDHCDDPNSTFMTLRLP